MPNLTIGILGFQGAIEPHEEKFASLAVKTKRVTERKHLEGLAAIVFPGGESSTMLKLIHSRHMWEPLREFCRSHPCWGVCAGAILLAQEVTNPSQTSLGIINVRATRNAYGSQQDSFSASVVNSLTGADLAVDFIRAPKLEALTPQATPLYLYQETPVAFQQGRCIVTAFHTELITPEKGGATLHETLLKMCE
jgi:pyridoxal 5'-phosphate synthase pdxT subunit